MKIHWGYHHFPIEIALLAYVCGIHEEFHGERWAITIFMGIPWYTGNYEYTPLNAPLFGPKSCPPQS